MTEERDTFDCPACGAEVPAGALACPECGSDDETGWSEDAEHAHLDLPTGYASEEPEPAFRVRPWSGAWLIVGVVVMIVLLIVLGLW